MMYEKLQKLIKNQLAELDVNVDEVGRHEDLFTIGIDSVGIIKLIVAIESEFKIEFDDEDLYWENVQTIDKIMTIINHKMEEKDAII